MSDPIAELRGAPDVDAPRESRGGVIAVGIGLILIAAAVLSIVLNRPRELDPRELLEQGFTLGELPAGFALESGLRLPSGEELVVLDGPAELEDGDALPLPASEDSEPAPEADPLAAEPAATSGARSAGKPDWAAIPEGEAGTPPARVFLAHSPGRAAAAALDRAFRRVEWKDLSDLDAKGGRTVVDGGKLEWADYSADWLRERLYEPGGTYRDTVRVNLSVGERCWILHAFWPRGLPGGKEPLEPLLAALAPR